VALATIKASRTMQPLNGDNFLSELKQTLGRDLEKKKPGPKPG
jgi:hypothetical protein